MGACKNTQTLGDRQQNVPSSLTGITKRETSKGATKKHHTHTHEQSPYRGVASYRSSTHVQRTGGTQDDAWPQRGGGAWRKRTMHWHSPHQRCHMSYGKGAWCMMHSAQRTVLYASGAWHTVRGAGHRETVHGAWCKEHGAWGKVRGAWCVVQGV
jgi:hypothetical protein